MNFPKVAFDILGTKNEEIKLEILEVFGFPNETSFRGGYDLNCKLQILVGNYSIKTNNYLTSSGSLYNFYIMLKNCYDNLNGSCDYKVDYPENDLQINLNFIQGKVFISGFYRDNLSFKNILNFEFESDQSYFNKVLKSLKNVIDILGDNKGIKK